MADTPVVDHETRMLIDGEPVDRHLETTSLAWPAG